MKNLFVQFSGFDENGSPTEIKSEIIKIYNIDGVITMDLIFYKLENVSGFSPYRNNRTIIIHSLQKI